MSASYESVASFAQTWGLVLFVIAFALVVAYAFWPGKKRKKEIEDAANIPLKED
ncbi:MULTISPECIES: cbb3-type cytochrome c oxidase subunit 3 [Xanthobacter]|uniref:cbb3-type cytochrome c oxidase subunit 3 n=1 Tax=Xanthobacter TaxID=279 RepID=UPI001F211048|nr:MULTISPECIES: cbb3-type cytochrome c oxidase subunit 3 [unclassified Xanthobacter]